MKIFSFLHYALISFLFLFSANASAFKLGDALQSAVVSNQLDSKPSDAIKSSIFKGVLQTMTGDGGEIVQNIKLKGIETTKEWQDIYNMAFEASQKVSTSIAESGQSFNYCSVEMLAQFNLDQKMFDYQYNSKLIKNASFPSRVLDISSYRELSRFNKNSNYAPLHLPNVGIVNYIFKLPNEPHGNIYQNFSAIMLPEALTKEAKNQYVKSERNIVEDARNPYVATLRDIATVGYLIIQNPGLNINFEDYFIMAMQVHSRNKLMCLYNI